MQNQWRGQECAMYSHHVETSPCTPRGVPTTVSRKTQEKNGLSSSLWNDDKLRDTSCTLKGLDFEHRYAPLAEHYSSNYTTYGSCTGNSKTTSLLVIFLYTDEKVSSFVSTFTCPVQCNTTLYSKTALNTLVAERATHSFVTKPACCHKLNGSPTSATIHPWHICDRKPQQFARVH